MKSKKKLVRTILGVILILIACIVILINLFGNRVIKTGIETVATKTLTVPVNIDDMSLSILRGKVSFQNLVVDNPPGYEYDKLLEVGDARIAVSIGSLLKDTVNIKEIMFDGLEVTLEQKGLTSNNLQDIIKALPKSDKEPEPEEKTNKPSKKLHIDKLEISNVVVNAKLLPIPGKETAVTLKLDPIIMTDLGSDDNMDIAKLSSKILLAIATGVAKQGTGVLPEGITDGMEATLSKVTELGKTVSEEGKKFLEEGKDTGKDIVEGFKGLLKPKK